jgi:hypothetical protein
VIKFETIGAITAAKNNPTITSNSAVKNYTFLTYEGTLYLVMNVINGDDSYVDDVTIPAGEFLRGIDVKSIEGLKLIVDGKHVTYASGKTVADIEEDDILTVGNDGKLAVAESAPNSGVYFTVTKTGVKLTEAAFVAKVCVA